MLMPVISYIEKYTYWMLSFVFTISGLLLYYTFGQPVTCPCAPIVNGFGTKSPDSQSLVDWYTMSHFIYGAVALWILNFLLPSLSFRIKLLAVVVASAGWELVEHTDYVMSHFRSVTISTKYYGDSIVNSLGDVLGVMTGVVLTTKIRVYLLILFILVLESASMYFIHDNFTLNILSFVLPQDMMQAITKWQTGF